MQVNGYGILKMNAKYVQLGMISPPMFEVKLNKFETFGVKYPEDLITISTTHPNRCLLWSIASVFNKGKKTPTSPEFIVLSNLK